MTYSKLLFRITQIHRQNEGRRILRCCLHLRPRHASDVRRGGGGGSR